MEIKTDFDGDFRSIMLLRRRGRRVTVDTLKRWAIFYILPLHEETRNIYALKLRHSTEICNSGSVPDDCRLFFTNLLGDNNIEEEAVVPDINDPEVEDLIYNNFALSVN